MRRTFAPGLSCGLLLLPATAMAAGDACPRSVTVVGHAFAASKGRRVPIEAGTIETAAEVTAVFAVAP